MNPGLQGRGLLRAVDLYFVVFSRQQVEEIVAEPGGYRSFDLHVFCKSVRGEFKRPLVVACLTKLGFNFGMGPADVFVGQIEKQVLGDFLLVSFH